MRVVCVSRAYQRLYTTHAHCHPARPSHRSISLSPSAAAAASASSMADALKSLENVTNARDFATATPNIAPGRIFRSGNPANGTAGDVQVLRMQLGIRQMLDFRSSEEHAEDKGWPLMLSRGTMKTYDANGQLSEVSVAHNEQLAGLDLPPCELHTLSLLERNRFIRALIWRLPPWKVAQALGYKALGYEEQMRDVLVPEINKAGLPLIYEILMDTAAADIQRALHIIAAAAESNTPQLLFCKLGKDRTGLMSALVLACCGATDEEIIADYARSDGTDEVALGGMEKKRELQGMDRQLFASAPPEAMRVTLEYAKTKYGGLRGYMETIGFDKAAQRRLGEALSPETAW